MPVLLTSTLLYQQTDEVSKRHLPALEKPFDLDELLAQVERLLE